MSKSENCSDLAPSDPDSGPGPGPGPGPGSDLGLPPPSYTEATGSVSTSRSGFSTSSSGPVPVPVPVPAPNRPGESPLTTHLRTLPSRLRSAQHIHSTTQSQRESFLVGQCVPHIEWFIEDIVNLPKTPRVAELVLVPAEALPSDDVGKEKWEEMTSAGRELMLRRKEREDKGWEMVGEKEIREEGGVIKVVCVSVVSEPVAVDEKGRPLVVDRKTNPGNPELTSSGTKTGDAYSFGEWGRFETTSPSSSTTPSHLQHLGPEESWNWFSHPKLSRSIASVLRPEPTLSRKTVQAAVESPTHTPKSPSSSSSSTAKKGFGSFFRRSSSKQCEPQSIMERESERVITPVRDGGMLGEDKVAMTVRAEEVTFRRENEFGVWESVSGWGVVVGVRVGRL